MAKKRFPSIEPVGDGWRATVRIEGKLRKGKKRSSQKAAHADAAGLQELREAGQGEGLSTTLDQAMKRVLARCDLQQRRKGTVNWYENQFAILKKEFGETTKLGSIDKKAVQAFVERRAKTCGPRTIRHGLQALRRLFNVCDLPPPTRNLVLPGLEQREPNVFEWKDVVKLLEKVKKVDEFEWAVLGFYFYTGVRRAESARIKITDVDWEKKILHVKLGKRKPRSLPVPDGLLNMLLVFNDTGKLPAKMAEGDGLLPGEDEEKRTGYTRRVFEKWSTRLKEKKLTPHAARHTFGSALAEKGVPVHVISRLMGHDIGGDIITQRYITAHDPELRKAMELLWAE